MTPPRAARELRFGIRDGQKRAATWKTWTESPGGRSELYIGSRHLSGQLKASLHDSGEWHIAYSEGFFQARVAGTGPADRFVTRWTRPAALQPGVTLAFRIVTPALAVTSPISPSDETKLCWIPNAPTGKATEIDVILTAPGALTTAWPGQRSMGTQLAGSVQLANGDMAWVVHWVVAMPDLSGIGGGQVAATFYRGAAAKTSTTLRLCGRL